MDSPSGSDDMVFKQTKRLSDKISKTLSKSGEFNFLTLRRNQDPVDVDRFQKAHFVACSMSHYPHILVERLIADIAKDKRSKDHVLVSIGVVISRNASETLPRWRAEVIGWWVPTRNTNEP